MQYFSPNACTPDLWRYLQSQAGRPILLWGMGDGADKVLDVCAEYGIAVADVFASDGFVRGQSFRGRRVLSFGEARATYGDCMIVLLAFGSRRPDVLDNIRHVAAQCELYIPDVPVSGGALFTASLCRHIGRIWNVPALCLRMKPRAACLTASSGHALAGGWRT